MTDGGGRANGTDASALPRRLERRSEIRCGLHRWMVVAEHGSRPRRKESNRRGGWGAYGASIDVLEDGDDYQRVGEDRQHLSGDWAAMQMLDGLARGLDAFIPSRVLPAYVEVSSRFEAGNREGARALFEQTLPILAFSNQHFDVSIPFWKRVRQAERIFTTARCRPPIPDLDPVQGPRPRASPPAPPPSTGSTEPARRPVGGSAPYRHRLHGGRGVLLRPACFPCSFLRH